MKNTINRFLKWLEKCIVRWEAADNYYKNNPDYIDVGGFEGIEWIKKTDIKNG